MTPDAAIAQPNRQASPAAAGQPAWATIWQSTWGPAWLSALLLWAAFPPLDLWPLAWLAPIPWLALIGREKLTGRRPYLALWLAGFGFWMAAIYWIALPYFPATLGGLLALAFYLAFYTPVFVGLARVAVHRFRVPLPLSAAVVWTGLELARAYILDGFGMVYLGHTQSRLIPLIQISDLAGAYGVSFVVMFVAGCLWLACWANDRELRVVALGAAGFMMACTLGYGFWRTSGDYQKPGPRIAIVQECIEQSLRNDAQNAEDVIDKHVAQSRLAAEQNPDLIVWPETMWRYPLAVIEKDAVPPDGVPLEDLEKIRWMLSKKMQTTAQAIGRPLLLGMEFQVFGSAGKPKRFNSAVMIQPSGDFVGRYDKVHRVIFGEYIPLAETLPWLYDFTPLAGGITAGDPDQGPMQLGQHWIAPSICFESTVPHRIRRQINAARAADHEPDVLVNLTNDAWFWGSCQLDQHLACAIFRAVENRKPMLVSANTGLSAAIDSDGRLEWVGPRWDKGIKVVDVKLDKRSSPYSYYGDWPAGICLLLTGLLAGAGWWNRGKPV